MPRPLDDTLPESAATAPRSGRFRAKRAAAASAAAGHAISQAAWRRVKFDELLAQQLSMRFAYRRRRSAPGAGIEGERAAAQVASSSDCRFELTKAQTRAMNEVLRDLREPHPMQRLLQGDVGSGKTVVAAIACLAAVDSGAQAAVMAPTEILSEQHWRKFSEWLAPLGVRLGWLHGGMRKKREQRDARRRSVLDRHACPDPERTSSSRGSAWSWSTSSTASASSSASRCARKLRRWCRTS